MVKVVGIRFKRTGKTYFFDPGELELMPGNNVIVETSQGVEMGEIAFSPKDMEEEKVVFPLKQVMRVATKQDHERIATNKHREEKAIHIVTEQIQKHKLEMNVVDIEYTFDGRKVTVYFTADGRVDFRELVRDLAKNLHARVELRQIGVRDETRMLGGLGPCGRETCCKQFLCDFKPVSIKMAKDQNLSLNPTKISGLCGRLMCCLEYEHCFYKEIKKKLISKGSDVMTPDGPGELMDNMPIMEKCKVKVTLSDGTNTVMQYALDDVKRISKEEKSDAMKHLDRYKRAEVAPQTMDMPDLSAYEAENSSELRTKAKASMQKNTDRPNNRNRRRRRKPRQNNNSGSNPGTANKPNTPNKQGADIKPDTSNSASKPNQNQSSKNNRNRRRKSNNTANRNKNTPQAPKS